MNIGETTLKLDQSPRWAFALFIQIGWALIKHVVNGRQITVVIHSSNTTLRSRGEE